LPVYLAKKNGDLGSAPSVVQGQNPWLEGQEAKPPEAEDISAIFSVEINDKIWSCLLISVTVQLQKKP